VHQLSSVALNVAASRGGFFIGFTPLWPYTKSSLATPNLAGQITIFPYGLAFCDSGLCNSDLALGYQVRLLGRGELQYRMTGHVGHYKSAVLKVSPSALVIPNAVATSLLARDSLGRVLRNLKQSVAPET
jgi:hypothetical protein